MEGSIKRISITTTMVEFTKFAATNGLDSKLTNDNCIQLFSVEKQITFIIDVTTSEITLHQAFDGKIRGKHLLTTSCNVVTLNTCISIMKRIAEEIKKWKSAPAQFYLDSLVDIVREKEKRNEDYDIVELEGSVGVSVRNKKKSLSYVNIYKDENDTIIILHGSPESPEGSLKLSVNPTSINYNDLELCIYTLNKFFEKFYQ